MRTESEATPKKKAPVKVKNLPFPLPKFEATPYTPAPTVEKAKPKAKPKPPAQEQVSTPAPFPFSPRGGGLLQPPAAAARQPGPTYDWLMNFWQRSQTVRPNFSALTPAPNIVGQQTPTYRLPDFTPAPNMSTPEGPRYSPPPAIARQQAPVSGAGYAPGTFSPPSVGPLDRARQGAAGPYMPMVYREQEQAPAQQGPLMSPMAYDLYTGEAATPNMSTANGPVYAPPLEQIYNAFPEWAPNYVPPAATPAPAETPAAGGSATSGGTRSRSSRYYPRTYYGSSGGGYYGGGGGGGGSANAGDYERYGISKPWMEAFKAFWGHDQPAAQWGLYNSLVELFARYANRMPQLEDWTQLWAAIKEDYTARGLTEVNPYSRLEMYEPIIEKLFARQPAVQLPTVSYAPALSF